MGGQLGVFSEIETTGSMSGFPSNLYSNPVITNGNQTVV